MTASTMPQAIKIARPPKDADVYRKVQYIMYSAHEIFREGYNSIVKLLRQDLQDDLLKNDAVNFMDYVHSWFYVIDHHHHSEERILFDVFRKNGVSIDLELSQHKQIDEDLQKVHKYVEEWTSSPEKFDSAELLVHFEKLGPNLFEHLNNEVVTLLDPETVAKEIGAEDLQHHQDAFSRAAQKESDPTVTFPYALTHTSPEQKDWHEAPWFVVRIFAPIWYIKHRAAWKYSPYTLSSSIPQR
ncbi:hypothetical protein FA10DRAFT_286044 [Acaromyces ingoldii]|uniref:Hemerythrin-like domain-containing protein n=1 Tax=Acaromyces ingoldii TaxID=215250 RepID=A0A316YNF1_9BASI|nr:hypothetical protein FA10DRAFT_286044 [Acaromyces ingoldii]PWN90334.1 hypothetical protein FA10DRAFT_286044 [Acaromyces ingoldii]